MSLPTIWRRLNLEQRVAAVAAVLLIISTFGRFSFVEAGIVLTGIAVLALLHQRADRRRFHLPFGDGTVILAAGVWCALLIVTRMLDRPFGQSVLALACAAVLAVAGLRERTKRPADDLPPPARTTRATNRQAAEPDGSSAPTEPLSRSDDATVRLPPMASEDSS